MKKNFSAFLCGCKTGPNKKDNQLLENPVVFYIKSFQEVEKTGRFHGKLLGVNM